MSVIRVARAYANNEVAYLAWQLSKEIPDCLGFEITRIYPDGTERVLPAWVPFERQSNKDWKPQTTAVWPIQKLSWRDLTLRKRRDATERRPADVEVKYRIRPVVPAANAGTADLVKNVPPVTYTGHPVPLAYYDEGAETNEVLVTSKYGDAQVAFTNGILAAQWLTHALEDLGEGVSAQALKANISEPGNKLRSYLTGDVLDMLKQLLARAANTPDAEVHLALYELADEELCRLLETSASRIRIILSNSSKERGGTAWDAGNAPFRKRLIAAKPLELLHRMFNNSARIGHNKFAVLVVKGKAKAVLTGSTNWTPNGLCAQSNNAMIIDNDDIAAGYEDYWQALRDDTLEFQVPKPFSKSTSNVQGAQLRTENAQGLDFEIANTKISLWRAPNTHAVRKKDETPPDLAAVYRLMRKAQRAIFFAVFLPSRTGKLSIIEEAITIGKRDPSILVYGSISDVTAMPNYVPPPPKSGDDDGDDESPRRSHPSLFDSPNVHVVRASALTHDDIIGDFEHELLKAGNAIIHDKIVVIDPLSDDSTVVIGSHNLGYKASYQNDENLLILRKNRRLAEAYTVHLLDLYEHYRFRAVQEALHAQGKKGWDGFLSRDGRWLADYVQGDRSDLARYLCS